ncbi:response regulator [Subsaximicrobium wynnwilliamsii]|uniref:histidine kinase n=1 Tax=Subsaximicrobium wynnwilliamsii TaxID=291179 RepID=A0A5C6ZIU3_9FLAO|nr:two-component regulator propeller domain-containing protein [Subsaximicrobium wynnwilliamsii]TXD83663.1 response regulator [Subsaximicrobium wynnwilliamsii]TXD89452.1 response regulator [Subsaximicrobium wynnwilliamsii]TXE03500.1 response regulator [Subsaximicrobium wynnwilliamsii]
MKMACFLIGALFVIESNSQSQVSFRQLSVNDGLSQNSVVSVTQDSIGYLWLATQDGLNKFDGNKFQIYNAFFIDVTKPTYSHLGKVYTDREGNIISIPISKKPQIYNKKEDSFSPFSTLKDVSAVYQDRKKNYWFGTYNFGVFKMDGLTQKETLIIPPEDIGSIYSISEDSNGTIWLASQGKIVSVNSEDNTITPHFPDGNKNSTINYAAILFDASAAIWIGSYGNGLWFKDSKSPLFGRVDTLLQEEIELPDNLNILSMHIDKKNRLWIGTFGDGLYKMSLNTFEVTHFEVKKHNPRALHYNDILCIYEDYTGTLWFGTDGAGVSFYDEYLEKFNVINNSQIPEEVNIDLVRAIQVDKNDDVWIGTSGKGLSRYTPKTNLWKTYTEKAGSLSSNRIVSLLIDDDQDLWIGTQGGGLNIMQTNGETRYYNKNSTVALPTETIWDIFEDSSNATWLATRDHGMIQFDKNKGVLKTYDTSNGLPSNNVRVIIQGEDQKLWVGTEENGVLLIDPKTETFIDFQKDFNIEDENYVKKVKSLYYDQEGLLWVGTNGYGLSVFNFKNKTFHNYTIDDGLPNNVIYAILPDANNNLWLSSNRGITMITAPQDLNNKPVIANYDNYDGLATEFNTGAYFKSKNNVFYFGGLEGYYWFNPEDIQKNQVLPKTVITDFEVFNTSFPLVNNTELKYKQNTVSFTFSSLQFSLPKKNKYSYKLENYDENWIESKNSKTVRYTNLPFGSYTFLVKSSNYDGVWNEKPVSFSFSILKPWYLSSWMFFVYALLTLLISVLTYYYFKWKWKMTFNLKQEKQESGRLKRLDEYKTKLYTNLSHEFRTPLTLISGPIKKQLLTSDLKPDSKNDLQLVERNIDQMLSLVDQLLELSKLESGKMTLKVKQNDLGLYLKVLTESFQFLAEQHGLKLSAKIPDIEEAWFDADSIERIVNNLFSNAIKYTSKGGVIAFSAKRTDDNEIRMTFINDIDGIIEKDIYKIFNRFYQINEDSEGSGIGLSLVKELTSLCHGTIEASYVDASKMKFVVNLPITKNAFLPNEIDTATGFQSRASQTEMASSNTAENTKKPIALVVDDNQDIRAFIKSLLVENFRVIEAKDGFEGIEKAFKTIPDIIISDLVMPLKTGIELCEILKHDEKTSHIPIIILTGKTDEKDEIVGLNTGADDYITKPFNPKTLQIKVGNIIQNKNKLHQRYKQDNLFSPKEIAVTSADQVFLEKVQTILDQHLSNPEFTSEVFSKHVGMSRMQLHRKMLAYTGLSTSNFIRSQRLKQATSILKSSQFTINEVAYMVGFSTPSYFIKCFKEMYRQTPAEYTNN